MRRVKDFFINASKQLQEVFKRFPVTVVLIALITVFVYIQLQFEPFERDFYEKTCISTSIIIVGAFFIESFEKKKSITTYIGFLIDLIIGIVWYRIIYDVDLMKANHYLLGRLLGLYLLSLGTIGVFVLHKKSGMSFKEYVLKVFANLLKTSIYYAVFLIGTLTIYFIFDMLILKDSYSVYANLLFLTCGLFYVPIVLNGFIKVEEEISGFLRGLITYILFPVAIVSTALIYVYFAKIIILRDLPHNRIFEIIAWLFVSAFPVMVFANVIKGKDESKKLNNAYCYIYMPFVLMEIYSISLRIKDYGFTFSRYFACVFIISQIIIIALLLIKNGKYLNYILLILLGMAFISVIGPISFLTICNHSQEQRLIMAIENYNSIDEMPEEEIKNAKSIINYLYSYDDEKFIEELNDKNTIVQDIDNYYYNSYYSNDYSINYEYINQSLEDMDITNYKKMIEVKIKDYDQSGTIKVLEGENKFEVTVDFEELCKKQIEGNLSNKEGYIIKTNNSKYDFYCTNLSFTYKKGTKEIKTISYGYGYLLEKIDN